MSIAVPPHPEVPQHGDPFDLDVRFGQPKAEKPNVEEEPTAAQCDPDTLGEDCGDTGDGCATEGLDCGDTGIGCDPTQNADECPTADGCQPDPTLGETCGAECQPTQAGHTCGVACEPTHLGHTCGVACEHTHVGETCGVACEHTHVGETCVAAACEHTHVGATCGVACEQTRIACTELECRVLETEICRAETAECGIEK